MCFCFVNQVRFFNSDHGDSKWKSRRLWLEYLGFKVFRINNDKHLIILELFHP